MLGGGHVFVLGGGHVFVLGGGHVFVLGGIDSMIFLLDFGTVQKAVQEKYI